MDSRKEVKLFIRGIYLLLLLVVCSSQRFPGDRCTDSRRRSGACTLIRNCQVVQQEIRRGIRPTNCRFSGGQPIVCCPRQSPLSSDPTTSPPSRKPGDRAAYWCKEYNKFCPNIQAIAGGTPAIPDEFPHMAAVGYGPRNNIEWKCGGSLISDKFVLTAAHCLRGGRAGPAQWVLLGTVTLASNTSALAKKGQIHGVVRRIRHPQYRPPQKYNDVALLEIGPAISRNPVSLVSKQLHPACLRTDNSFKYSAYVATGWGRVGFGEEPSMELLKVQLDVFKESKCNETFETEIRTTNQLPRGIDSSMMCAGILQGGKDTCQGDSGGPLQYSFLGSCKHEIWGITSFGKICSFANSPSVYMRVSAFIPWIENIVWP